ncbi:MAG: translocation/assembly module TamB domain-containing protein [Myxococcota bacterium]
MVKDAPLPTRQLQPHPKRPRAPLRLVGLLFRRVVQILLLAVLVAIALAVGWLRSPDFQERAIRVVETGIERELGEPVTLTRVRVGFWRPHVDVDGFHVFSGTTGDTILSAERIRIPLALTWRGPKIGELDLQRPTVHLHVEADGKLREFQNRHPLPGRPKMKELPFTSIRIVDGSVTVEHPQGSVTLDAISTVPVGGKTDLSAELALKVRDLEDHAAIRWTGLGIGPDAIDIPSLALDLAALDVTGRAHVPLTGPLSADLSASVALDAIEPLLKPPRKAHGRVDVDLRVEGTTADPTLYVSAAGWDLGADMPGVFTPLLTYELHDMTASAVVRKSGIHLDQLVLPWAGGKIVAWGDITPDKRLVNGHVTMEDVSLAPLLQAFDAAPTPWVNFSSDAEIVVEGDLQPLKLDGTFELGVADLHVGNGPLVTVTGEPNHTSGLMLDMPTGYAEGRITLEKDHVLLDATGSSRAVRGPRSSGTALVDIGFGPRGPLDLQFDLVNGDLEDFTPLADVELKGKGRVSGRIAGPFNKLQFDGDGDIVDFSVLGIQYADHLVAKLHSPDMKSIYLTEAQAELGSSTYHGRYGIDFKPPISMTTAIEIDRGRVEDLVGMFVDLEGLKGDLTGTMTLDGPLFDMSGTQDIALSDVEIYGEHFPTGEGHGSMDQGLFTLDDLRVRRDGGKAGLTLRGSVKRDWKLDMELTGDGLELAKLDRLAPYELPLSGRLAVSSRITNTLFDPSPDGRIWLTDLRYAGVKAADSVITVDSEGGIAKYHGELLGRTAHVDGTLGLWGEQPYALTAKLDQLPAHLFYPIAADGTPIHAVVSGEVTVSGDFGEVWSPVALAANLDRVEATYGSHVLRNQGPWSYTQEGNRYELTGFNLSGGATRFALSARGGDPLQVAGDGTIDLDLLRAVVPGLEKSTGTADVTLYARGSRPNVEAVVDVDVSSELFRHSAAPLSFEDTKAKIQVRNDRIDVKTLAGSIGGGTFTGSGTIDAVDWKPVRYDLAMDVKDAMVQWVESLPPAIGDGTFRFDGPVDALLLSGDVDVHDMTFADRIDWEDWVVEYRDWMLVDPASIADEPPMFSMNVEISADRTIWLRNNVAEGNASADLRIIGDTVRPGLVGTVTVNEGGLAFLQDREFRIDRGNLLFNDPWTWDPQLDISLLTDITSRDQRYRVDYQVKGPFSNWHTETRSDPPLPQADVNALLWFGVTTDELEEMGELPSAVVQGVADLLVTDFLVSGQAGDLGEELPVFLFDRIDLATGVNARGEYSPEPRLVVEKRLPEDLGAVDLKWEFNLVRPNDNYVTASKRIGGIWSLAGWYATLQRERALPIGGAYGVDVVARWEIP